MSQPAPWIGRRGATAVLLVASLMACRSSSRERLHKAQLDPRAPVVWLDWMHHCVATLGGGCTGVTAKPVKDDGIAAFALTGGIGELFFDDAPLRGAAATTVMARIKPTNLDGLVAIVQQPLGQMVSPAPYAFLFLDGNDVRFTMELGTHEYPQCIHARDRIRGGRWTHVAGVFDGVGVTLYVDGAKVSESTEREACGEAIAGREVGRFRPFAGLMGELSWYAIALSSAEIAADYLKP